MFYETTLLISHDVEQSKVFDVWTEMIQKAKETGLSIQKDTKPYMRTLAYPIGKYRKAYVATLYVEKTEGAVAKIKELIGEREEILRHLTTIVSHIPQPRQMARPVLKYRDAQEAPPRHALTTREASEKEKSARGHATLEEVDKKLQEILDDKISF